ncbi:phosphoglycerol transferase [Virgibacillus phasianinus]|uniref:Phosphoglycerol transferase n=1 Tax=Virgibacillus phasianinus TaxID=2017483 RepID=A0A220TY79_9BACI|nr:LTA synthase family protein [Virgibacillus phasianinus]ASK60772.1 phosphoglycerol transferase [Virgibacillus phasianinus]
MKKLTAYLSNHLIATTVILLWLKTVIVTYFCFDLTIVSFMDILLLIISPIGTLMLFIGISFLFGKRVHPISLIVIDILITGLLYANLLYFRFYIDFVTVSVLFQLNNVGGLGPSTLELLSPFDILLFIDIFVVGYLVYSMKKRRKQINKPARKKYLATSISLIVLTFCIGVFQYPHLLKTGYDREQLVESLGLYNYQLVNIGYGIKAPIEKALSDKSDAGNVSEYIQSKPHEQTDLFGLAKGKNVVLISLESTQNFVINQKVNGEEITPFLNDLIKKSFYFSNIYDQTAQGKTSDAEFMIDTGLYPLPSGSVFVRRPENTFESLEYLLKENGGYTTASFHGNDRDFWNRAQMYENLGYDHFFSKKYYDVTKENSINYGIKDIPFFEQSMENLTELPEPFMAKFITLSNHFPFLIDEADRTIEPANTEVDVVNRYVTTVRYEDQAIKRFFQLMKEQNMYKDTIFVIYGDHYGISKKYEAGVHELLGQEETPLNHLELQQVPLIIHIPGQDGRTINKIGGEVDIRATLLHLLGISTENQMAFSQSLFTRDSDKPVVLRDGGMISKDYAYLNNVCYDRSSRKAVGYGNCAPYLDTARKQLELSDNIILGDLLRFID